MFFCNVDATARPLSAFLNGCLLGYKRHRFPPEIIQYAVWLYYWFNLSHRDIEDLLAERGIQVSYESIRLWCNKFGPQYARRLKGQFLISQLAVLRCALLKQYRQLSYQELAFHLSDSASFQAFARLPLNLFAQLITLADHVSNSY